MHLPRVRLPDGPWTPWLIVGGTIAVTHFVDKRLQLLEDYGRAWATPIEDGTPMRQVVHPAVAWVAGIAPFPPTPMEMHAPMEVA
jgi:hypothetical protein